MSDTIEEGCTGFLFDDYTPDGFMTAAVRAVEQFSDPIAWQAMMREAMPRGFRWERLAAKYVQVYNRVLAPLKNARGWGLVESLSELRVSTGFPGA